jgi:hypothetical protein
MTVNTIFSYIIYAPLFLDKKFQGKKCCIFAPENNLTDVILLETKLIGILQHHMGTLEHVFHENCVLLRSYQGSFLSQY